MSQDADVSAAGRHPDQAWIAAVTEATRAWLSRPCAVSPTSQVTGGGAVSAAEAAFSQLHADRPAVLLPSGTYGMRVALQAVGVRSRDQVLVPGLDWPSTVAATLSLGAVPVPVNVDPCTLTISPESAIAARTHRTRAVVACHLHGVAADVPALRQALPGVAIVEDCAQALGSTLDGAVVGTLGDAAVLSLGPGKQVDAGEGGVLLLATGELHREALRWSAHPVRQLLGAVPSAEPGAFSVRVHPIAAVLALHALTSWTADRAVGASARARTRARMATEDMVVLGDDSRRHNAAPAVPVIPSHPSAPCPEGFTWTVSGARVVRSGKGPWSGSAGCGTLLAQVRLARSRDGNALG